MKLTLTIVALLLMSALGLFYLSCGGGGEETGGAGGEVGDQEGEGEDDDDEEEEDFSDCRDTVNLVYNCGFYFFDPNGYSQTADQAYTECLALFETSDKWKCRFNCAKGSLSCDMLYQCLLLCPTDDLEQSDLNG